MSKKTSLNACHSLSFRRSCSHCLGRSTQRACMIIVQARTILVGAPLVVAWIYIYYPRKRLWVYRECPERARAKAHEYTVVSRLPCELIRCELGMAPAKFSCNTSHTMYMMTCLHLLQARICADVAACQRPRAAHK